LIDTTILSVLAVGIPLITGALSLPLARVSQSNALSRWSCFAGVLVAFVSLVALLPSILLSPLQLNLFGLNVLATDIQIGIYIDLLSISFALIGSLFGVVVVAYGLDYFERTEDDLHRSMADRSLSFSVIMVGGLLGTLFSGDLFMLLIFWETMTLSLYALIMQEENPDAAFKAFLMTHTGGLALLAFTIIISSTLGTLQIHEIAQHPGLLRAALPALIPLSLVAALPKSVQFPFHTWFPDGTIVPSSTMVLFLATDLTGIYLLLRLVVQVFGPAVVLLPALGLAQVLGNLSVLGLVISLLGCITLLIGAINAVVESDVPRIIAYGASSELGFVFIVLGLESPLGVTASLFYAISHTLVVGLLFLCAGAVIMETGVRHIDGLGGLYHSMPITASCTALSVLAIGGLPLLSEFIAKYLVLLSAVSVRSPFFLSVAIIGELIHIVIATRILYSVFLARSEVAVSSEVTDPPLFMQLPMVLMAALIVILGLHPMLLLDGLILPSVVQLGMSIQEVLPFLILPIYGGIWSPIIITTATLVLFSVFFIAVIFSRNRGKYTHEPEEQAFKPFICGEDSVEYRLSHPDLFYTIRTDILNLERLVRSTDIDRLYEYLSRRVYGAGRRLLKLDVRHRFVQAFLWFIVGLSVLLVMAFLVV
jgi:formate hydrogenlyase subunit 3/multisubunit Na+/H+ antiporter MnhD subunit